MSAAADGAPFRVWERVQVYRSEHRGYERNGSRYEEIPDPEFWIYREQTIALLRRYFRLSVEAGRLPAFLGREFFRTRIKSERTYAFEDVVIFVHDVERSLEQLDNFSQQLLVWVVLQDFSLDEVGRILGCTRQKVARHLPVAVDKLSKVFLERGML